MFTDTQQAAIDQLRDEGYAVCIFTPEECRGVHTEYIEETMCSAGFESIDYMADDMDGVEA